MPNLQIENIDVQKLKVHDKKTKQHSKKQITQIAKSITEFGFISPILADERFEIIAGHETTSDLSSIKQLFALVCVEYVAIAMLADRSIFHRLFGELQPVARVKSNMRQSIA